MEKKPIKNKTLTFQEWLETINDNYMHHLGEYFYYLTHKPFRKKNTLQPTKAYHEWLIQNYYGQENKWELPEKFAVYSTKFGDGFFFQRR